MSVFHLILIYIVILVMVPSSMVYVVKKGTSGIKVMLLGINLTLLGGIFAVSPKSNLGGTEYLIVIFGLIISFIGIGKKD